MVNSHIICNLCSEFSNFPDFNDTFTKVTFSGMMAGLEHAAHYLKGQITT